MEGKSWSHYLYWSAITLHLHAFEKVRKDVQFIKFTPETSTYVYVWGEGVS